MYVKVYLCVCACEYVRPYGADAGVAIDDRAVTTVTLSGIRKCILNTNQISPGTLSDQSQLSSNLQPIVCPLCRINRLHRIRH